MSRSTIFSADAQCKSVRSADDQRSVSGRTVKSYVADHRWEPVRAYTLRARTNGGPLRTVCVSYELADALAWLGLTRDDAWRLN